MATENYLLLGQKKRMIEGLREKGITDENVLGAFDKMERHLFLESLLWPRGFSRWSGRSRCSTARGRC